MSAIAAAGGEAAAGLDAMVEADFHPAICTLEKVAVWFAFWAEAQSRPLYRSVVSELEERYLAQTRALCEQLIADGGYAGIDAADAAHGINALSDGLWADLLIDPDAFDHEGAKRICRMFLAAIFPQHFPRATAPAAEPSEPAVATVTSFPATAEDEVDRAHRLRLAAALKRRLFPAATQQVADLAAQVGTDLATVLDWLEGKAEPTSSRLGRLLAGFDPTFMLELYGDDLAAMRRGFEQRLAAAREDEQANRAALAILTEPQP